MVIHIMNYVDIIVLLIVLLIVFLIIFLQVRASKKAKKEGRKCTCCPLGKDKVEIDTSRMFGTTIEEINVKLDLLKV